MREQGLMAEGQDDVFDYVMSDTFVSETHPRPYRTGFRSRRHPQRPSLAYVCTLSDRDFMIYVRNGCRLPSKESDVAELDALRGELRDLRNEVSALRQALVKTVPSDSGMRGGLNVPPRA